MDALKRVLSWRTPKGAGEFFSFFLFCCAHGSSKQSIVARSWSLVLHRNALCEVRGGAD